MPSEPHGANTSSTDATQVRVQAVSPRGLWLWLKEREYFLPTEQFPWFAAAAVRDVYRVELLHGHVLHWPALDVDLDVDSLERPEDWPLVWR